MNINLTDLNNVISLRRQRVICSFQLNCFDAKIVQNSTCKRKRKKNKNVIIINGCFSERDYVAEFVISMFITQQLVKTW